MKYIGDIKFNLKKLEDKTKEYSRQKMDSVGNYTKIEFENKSFADQSQMFNSTQNKVRINRTRIMSAIPKGW